MPSRGFRVVYLRVQTVSVKLEWLPQLACRPEVVLPDRKWLPPAQIQRPMTPNVKEFSLLTPYSLLFVPRCFFLTPCFCPIHIAGAHAYRDQAFLGDC